MCTLGQARPEGGVGWEMFFVEVLRIYCVSGSHFRTPSLYWGE